MLCKKIAEHEPDAAAFDDRRGRSGVEIEYERAGLGQLVGVRERGVELEGCNLREPDQSGQVLAEAVIHVAVVAPAPHRCRLHPWWPVRVALLLVEELAVNPVRVALQRQGMVA